MTGSPVHLLCSILCLLALFGVGCDELPAVDDPRDLVSSFDAQVAIDADTRSCIGIPLACERRGQCTNGCQSALGCHSDIIEVCESATSELGCLDAHVDCEWIGERCNLAKDDCGLQTTEQSCADFRQNSGIPCSFDLGCAGIPERCSNATLESVCNVNRGCYWDAL